MRHLHAFLLTASVWAVAAANGALPLWMWALSPTDAFFESMSGITTTGSTVMTGLDGTPPGILLWRSLLQWIGGIGFVVTAIALLPVLRIGGMQLFRTESSHTGDDEMASAARFASATISTYLVLTLCCVFAYLIGGMTEFEAITHAFATVSTGGFSTYDASFGHFTSAYLEWVATLFMLAGALPFAWYIRGVSTRSWGSEQVWTFLCCLVAVILLLTAWRVAGAGVPLHETLRHVAFSVVSVVTTTGFATVDYTTWGPLAVAVFFCLTVVGGCTGSTSGGVKFMRWVVTFKAIRAQLRAIRYPDAITTFRYDGQSVGRDVVNGVAAFFMIGALTIFFIAMILAFHGLDMMTAISGAATAVANVGPGVGDMIGPSGNFATLPDGAKWALSFGMYAGRLEMLTVFVLATPVFWRELA